jgi:hypothetical protein
MKEAANLGDLEKNVTMRRWIYALFLCMVTIISYYLSLRWGGGKLRVSADLALAFATVVFF